MRNAPHISLFQCFAEDIIGHFYGEESLYKPFYDKGLDQNDAASMSQFGHFSQLVWKASQEMGVGSAKRTDGKFNVVLR